MPHNAQTHDASKERAERRESQSRTVTLTMDVDEFAALRASVDDTMMAAEGRAHFNDWLMDCSAAPGHYISPAATMRKP